MVYAGTAATYGRGLGLVVGTGMATEFGQIAEMLATVETGAHAAAGQPRPTRASPREGSRRPRRGHRRARAPPGPAVHRDARVRYRAGSSGRSRGAARGRHHLAGARRAAPRQARRPDAAARGRRDARQHVGDLLRQDRHADPGRDDGPTRLRGGAVARDSGSGVCPGRGVHERRRADRSRHRTRSPHRCEHVLRAGALASDATISRDERDDSWAIKGDPTEAALVVAAAKAGLRKSELESIWPRVHEIPFTSETKRMTTLHQTDDGLRCLREGCARGDRRGLLRSEHRRRRCAASTRRPGAESWRRRSRWQETRSASSPSRARIGPRWTTSRRGMTFLGLVGSERSAAARSESGDPHVRGRRDPRCHDHRRPSGHRALRGA